MRTSYTDGTSEWCSTDSAVEAFPCGSRSITRTLEPAWASDAAMLTVVVVLPTPPFWLATTITRVLAGRGSLITPDSASIAAAACRAMGVSPPAGGACAGIGAAGGGRDSSDWFRGAPPRPRAGAVPQTP